MPECTKHVGDRQLSCQECYTSEELEAGIAQLNEFKLPAGPGGGKSKPRRTDDPAKQKKKGWMDEMFS